VRHTPGLSRYGTFHRQEATCSRHVVLKKCILTTFCTEEIHVKGTLQGRDDVFRRVTSRNDKLRDVFTARRQYDQNALKSE